MLSRPRILLPVTTELAQVDGDRRLDLETVRRRFFPTVPVTRLRAWCRKGHLPAVRVGSSWWIHEAELLRQLAGGPR